MSYIVKLPGLKFLALDWKSLPVFGAGVASQAIMFLFTTHRPAACEFETQEEAVAAVLILQEHLSEQLEIVPS